MKQVREESPGEISLDLFAPELSSPSPGDVTIKVRACAFTSVDHSVSRGGYPRFASFPHIPGTCFSGTIHAVGEGVKNFHVGQEVVALPPVGSNGGCTEWADVAAQFVIIKPPQLSYEEAAVSTYSALRAHLILQPVLRGETILLLQAEGWDQYLVGCLAAQRHCSVCWCVTTTKDAGALAHVAVQEGGTLVCLETLSHPLTSTRDLSSAAFPLGFDHIIGGSQLQLVSMGEAIGPNPSSNPNTNTNPSSASVATPGEGDLLPSREIPPFGMGLEEVLLLLAPHGRLVLGAAGALPPLTPAHYELVAGKGLHLQWEDPAVYTLAQQRLGEWRSHGEGALNWLASAPLPAYVAVQSFPLENVREAWRLRGRSDVPVVIRPS
jgi:threonine dehydrogenase-like Zn-dependent dehydrogenase